jgi:hypothetical protein
VLSTVYRILDFRTEGEMTVKPVPDLCEAENREGINDAL